MAVWIVAETRNGALKPVTLELLGAGAQLAARLEVPLCAVLMGAGVSPLANHLVAYGAERVVVADHPGLQALPAEACLAALDAVLQAWPPAAVLMGHDPLGAAIAGRLAVRHQLALVGDCTAIGEDGALYQAPACDGASYAYAVADGRPWLATLRPGCFERASMRPADRPEVLSLPVTEAMFASPTVCLEAAPSRTALSEAEVVIGGGLGMGGPDSWYMLEQLARELGGVTGATRSVVSAGWRPADEQIGWLGTTIAPRLYVACGISGSSEHLLGVRGSRTLIAINRDPEAPVMRLAHRALVGDVHQVLPQLLACVRDAKRGALT